MGDIAPAWQTQDQLFSWLDKRADAVRTLAGRDPGRAGIVRKLADGGGAALDAAPQSLAPPVLDRGKMCVTVRISTESVDRSFDTMVQAGANLTNHAKNPVVLFDHQKTIPVGLARDSEGQYTVRKDGSDILGTTHFCQSIADAVHVFELIDKGALNGGSIGFLPNKARPQQDSDGRRMWGGMIVEEWELLEYSHVLLPDNGDCLVLAVEKGLGGRRLSPELVKALTPYLPERKPQVNGATLPTETPPMADATTPRPPAPGPEEFFDFDGTAWKIKANVTLKTKDAEAPADGQYVDPAQQADAPADPADDTEATRRPPGANGLEALYDALMMVADVIQEQLKYQERGSKAQEILFARADQYSVDADQIAADFSAEYPDLDPLADDADLTDDEPADKDVDEADDADEDAAAKKRKSLERSPAYRRLQKRLEVHARIKALRAVVKRMNRSHLSSIKEVSGFMLDDLQKDDGMSRANRVACKAYGSDLASIHDAHASGNGDADDDSKSQKVIREIKKKFLKVQADHKRALAALEAMKNGRPVPAPRV